MTTLKKLVAIHCPCDEVVVWEIGCEFFIPASQRKYFGRGKNAETAAVVVGPARDAGQVRMRWRGTKEARSMTVAWFHRSPQHLEWEAKMRRMRDGQEE